jgi:hypothetical protein
MLAVHRMLGQAQKTPYPQTQGAVQLKQLYHSYKEELLSSWKSLQLFFAPSYGDVVAGPDGTTLLGNTWKLNEEKQAIETRFSVFGTTLCLTNPGGEGVIYMAPCRYDASQMLAFHADFTIRNTAGECLTVIEGAKTKEFGFKPAKISACNDSMEQHFAWTGPAPGNPAYYQMFFGTGYLSVYGKK